MTRLRRFFPVLLTAILATTYFTGAGQVLAASPAASTSSEAGAAQDLPAGITRIASVEGITEYRLHNGLRVLLAPDQSKPTTTVNMTYLVGSRHESYGETGMAHLLEHMLFKGTPTVRNALGEFSRRGLRANGSTSSDRTNYFASFAGNPETLEWYLGWQADAMINSTILRSDLDTEMTVVRNEMESGENNPFRILMQKMLSTAYTWHNYGKSTIGARSDVENVDIAQLRSFYQRYYQPDNAVLIVAGQFDPATTLANIARDFGRIPRPERELPPLYTVEPVQDGERSVTLRRAGGTPLVATMYHTPSAADPDFVAFEAVAVMMGDTPSGRLYHQLVSQGKASDVFGFTFDQHDPGIVMFGAQLQPDMEPSESLWGLIDTVETVAQTPFTQEELERARAKLLLDWEQTYSDPQRVGVALSEAIAAGDWRLFFLRRDRIRELKLADTQRVAEQWLLRSNRTEGRYIPTESPIRAPEPKPIDIQSVVKDYRGDPGFTEAEAFDPSPENIDKRTELRTLELPNGSVSMALLPKQTRGDRVHARLQLQFGDVESLKGQRSVAEAVADLLDRGTTKLSRQQIQDRFDQLEASVSFSGAGTDVLASMSTTREHLPELLALVLDILRNPTFPAEQVEEYRRAVITSIHDAMTEPTQIAARTLARHDNPWPRDDVRYVPSFEEDLEEAKALQREALQAFHEWFYGAGRIHFSAVGDFDPNAVQKALADGLAGWQQAPAWERIPSPYRDVPAKDFVIETPDKANAFFLARLPMQVQDTDPDFAALYLANSLLGQSETSRLWTRVREKEGLSYDVRSMLSISSFEPSASWSAYAIYAPSNRKQVETAIREELTRVTKEGFTQQEVAEGVTALLNQRRLTRAQDGALASTWINYLETGRTFAWSADIDRQLKELTAEKVNAVVRKYLQPNRFSTAVAGDFKKK